MTVTAGNSFLATNLDALRRWTRRSAELIAAAAPAAGFAWRLGRDGLPTFARASADGATIEWLGGTSMPSVSAESLVSSMDPGAGNGLALGIGSGAEWPALLARLRPHQMLFVLESDLGLLRMALEITDLRAPLASGRLILLAGPESESAAQLAALLAEHPGYTPPTVMHPLPTLSPERRNELLTLGERLIRPAVTAHALALAQAAQQLATGSTRAVDGGGAIARPPRRIYALLATPEYRGQRSGPELLGALARCATTESLYVDRFESADPLLWARRIAAFAPDLLLSDLDRAHLGLPFSAELPVYTLVEPEFTAGAGEYWAPERLPRSETFGPADRLICHAGAHRDRLRAAGFSAAQMLLIPPAIALPDTSLAPAETAAGRHRVALVGDVASVDPEQYGLNLPSHVDVWQAACAIVREEALHTRAAAPADILRRAQQRAHVDLQDAVVADSLERGIRDILLPSLTLWTVATQLGQAGIALKLIGRGWDEPKAAAALPGGAVVTLPDGAGAVWEEVAVALWIAPDGHVAPLLLEAPFFGVALVGLHQTAGAASAESGGGMWELLTPPQQAVAAKPGQLVATLRSLLREGPRRQSLALAAAEHIRGHHLWDHRATMLWGR
jgi:hypothetical protein